MNTHRDPRELAIDLLDRSRTNVQVTAVLSDSHGIFSWGWNHTDGKRGVHAEEHAIERANKKRLTGAKLTVTGRRKRSKNFVCARPCDYPRRDGSRSLPCMELAKKYSIAVVEYTDKDGSWKVEEPLPPN